MNILSNTKQLLFAHFEKTFLEQLRAIGLIESI